MEVIVDTTKGVYKEQIVRCRDCKRRKACVTFEIKMIAAVALGHHQADRENSHR